MAEEKKEIEDILAEPDKEDLDIEEAVSEPEEPAEETPDIEPEEEIQEEAPAENESKETSQDKKEKAPDKKPEKKESKPEPKRKEEKDVLEKAVEAPAAAPAPASPRLSSGSACFLRGTCADRSPRFRPRSCRERAGSSETPWRLCVARPALAGLRRRQR